MNTKPTTRWTVRVPPKTNVVLKDGTIVHNTSPHSTAYLKIEMEAIQSPQEQSDEKRKSS